MQTTDRQKSSKTTGVICTVLGGVLALWVIARLSSAAGWQQTWAPPFAAYEWVTLLGGAAAAGLLIFGLVQWTRPVGPGEEVPSRKSENQKQQNASPLNATDATEAQT